MAAGESRGNQVLLFIAIINFILFVGVAFFAFKNNTDWEKRWKQAQEWQQELDGYIDQNQQIKTDNLALNKILWGSPNNPDYRKLRDEIFVAAAKTISESKRNEVEDLIREVSDETGNSNLLKALENRERNDIEHYKKQGNFRRVCLDLMQELSSVSALVPHLRNKTRIVRDVDMKKLRGERAEVVRKLEEEKEDFKDKYEKSQEDYLALSRDKDIQRREFQDQINSLRQEIEESTVNMEIEVSRLTTLIKKREDRIEKLIDIRERSALETTPDGTVTFADNRLGLVWIDLGRKHGLRRGLRFEAFQFEKGGSKRVKGMVEVRKVDEEIAQCAIIDSYFYQDNHTGAIRPADNIRLIPPGKTLVKLPKMDEPIIEGDSIRSPFFERGKQQVFVFIGDERGVANPRYGLDALKAKIRSTGARLDPRVTIETGFAVALGNADTPEYKKELEKAIQYGLIILREGDLIQYLAGR